MSPEGEVGEPAGEAEAGGRGAGAGPATLVVFGASGDLMKRKLGPALASLHQQGSLPPDVQVLGSARTDWDDEAFRAYVREGLEEHDDDLDPEAWEELAPRFHYLPGDMQERDDYRRLAGKLDELDGGEAGRLYYLAVSPSLFDDAVEGLGEAGLAEETGGWRRVVVEKPFGRDTESARHLNRVLHAVFRESQVYRIDHYLGKETAQNLLFLRFANTIFEPLWNRNFIDHVQITVTEEGDVGRRAGYYDRSGVFRDMFQNHLLQLFTLVAMEPPAPFTGTTLRDEKVKVLAATRAVDLSGVVCGQYEGYRDAEGVAPRSRTPTFGALELFVDNWRWQGVPFYLRSGKAMPGKTTEIAIVFERPPTQLFGAFQSPSPNVLSICIQPDEGVHLSFDAKVPGETDVTASVDLEFHYRDAFEDVSLPGAYERLLLDALQGDPGLFARADEIDAAWRLIDPVVTACESGALALATYAPGTDGPPEADALLGRGRHWHLECGDHG